MHPYIHAQRTPGKPAHIMAGSGETVTYAQLDARSNQAAQLFRSLGFKAGSHIALFMENSARFLEICWGAQRSGLYYTPISSRLTADEVDYIVNDCDAGLFITSAALAPVAQQLAGRMVGVLHRYAAGGDVDGYLSWEEAAQAQPAEPVADQSRGSDMLYSSGTTGRPKGIKRDLAGTAIDDRDNLTDLLQLLYGANDQTVYLSPAPLYHAAPLRFNMTVQALGGTCVIMEHFDPEESLALIETHKVTMSQWVPTMFVRMLKMPEEARARHDLSSHACAIHAAAPCPVQIKRRMLDWWGPIIHEYYAGTEGNGFCAITAEEWLEHEGSVGRAIVGALHICDDSGRELPAGETGGIYMESENTFAYHKDREKTAASRLASGWSTLGDIGRLDKDGYLYLTDRKAHMIICGGVNVYPQEVENLLVTHPKVADAAVIGVPNEDLGEEVKAVVQPLAPGQDTPETAAELIAFCREHLSSIKCPKSVDFLAELPRHPTGKLYKRLIRDRYWGNTDSRIV